MFYIFHVPDTRNPLRDMSEVYQVTDKDAADGIVDGLNEHFRKNRACFMYTEGSKYSAGERLSWDLGIRELSEKAKRQLAPAEAPLLVRAHMAAVDLEAILRQRPQPSSGMQQDRGHTVESTAAPQQRRGSLNKDDSEAKRIHMINLLSQHPSLKDDKPRLASDVGVNVKTVNRWLAQEKKKYTDSKTANPDPDEE